jgi:predicted signal transduction protein with EAL and GGDEF domain
VFPHDGTDAQALLNAADAASYAAKRGGKHRVHVAGGAQPPAMAPVALRRVQ